MKLNRRLIKKIQSKQSHDEIDSEGSWAVSYGDMITLLLTFFIIFFSIKPVDNTSGPNKNAGLQIALIKALKADNSTALPSPTQNMGQMGSKKEPVIAEDNSNQQGLSKKMLDKIKGVPHLKGDEILVEFPEISFFYSSKIELTKDGEDALKEFSKAFLPYMGHFQVSIRAFTDSRKVKNSSEYRFKDNLELSALRGVAAMRLMQLSGLPLERIKVAGYGEMRTTMRDIASLSKEYSPEEKAKALSLSRKIVLVIEPIDANNSPVGDTNEI
jgi:chemotaxis protein MotB